MRASSRHRFLQPLYRLRIHPTDYVYMILKDSLELLRFAFVGALNTTASLSVIFFLMAIKVNLFVANMVGYMVGLVISFTLNRRWTFRSTEQVGPRLVGRFILAVSAAYCSNVLAVLLCVRGGVSPYMSQIIGMPIYTICFYLLSRFLVFRKTSDKNKTRESMERT